MSWCWTGATRQWLLGVVLSLCAWTAAEAAAPWFALGPYGGDARSIAADPTDSRHLYLGTENGWVYQSHDGGLKWQRLAQISKRNDLVIDHILADVKNPRRLIVGAWIIGSQDGGLFISEDAGHTWYSQAQLSGQSILALARSVSNPQEIVAGTLKGVFRSMDNGVHWTRISPEGSTEIHEVESIAIDPIDGDVIYAGTWHLPWKTSDGGAHWENIKEGIIDDSDVFSIIVDPQTPKTVYASACSGIYKSEDAGAKFRKVQGIPAAARRTRKLAQDPQHLEVVFAGTTEGLYRTLDSGTKWERLTGGDVIVNDVFVDPANTKHVLLATDRGGVYRSEDGGETFEPSNEGFSARQVVAYASDPHNPADVYVGVVNDKTTGGVFVSHDGGLTWKQVSEGLNGRDVFSLLRTADGTMLAGTGHGVFRMEDGAWTESASLALPGEATKEQVASRGESKALPNATEKRAKEEDAAAAGIPHVVPARDLRPTKGAPTKAVPADKRAKGVRSVPAKGRTAAARRGAPSASGARQANAAAKRRPRRMMFVSVRGAMLKPALWEGVPQKKTRARVAPATAAKKPVKPAAQPVKKDAGKAVAGKKVDAVVYAMESMGDQIFAGTSTGLFQSADAGKSWSKLTDVAFPDARFLAVHDKTVFVGTLKRLMVSLDGGATWQTVALPPDLTQIGSVSVDELGHLWVGGREGVYYSTNVGESWNTLRNLFITQVDCIYFDAPQHRVLVTSMSSTFAFAVSLPDYKVTYADTGWNLRFIRPVGDHMIGSTLFDGMVVQPRMVDSAFGEGKP